MNSISKYNQDSQNILLLTVNFPYGNSENFLSDELKYLSKKGSKILIFSHSSKGKSRYLPQGIKVVNISRIKKMLLVTFGTLYAF